MAEVQGTSDNDFIHRAGDGRTPPAGFNEITGVTSGDDVIRGDDGDDITYGDAGSDFLIGEDGRDKLFGGPGRDYLYSWDGIYPDANEDTVGGEVLSGGGGDDSLYTSGGSEVLDGGAGRDNVNYPGNAKLIVDLRTGTASDGSGEGDTLISIENVFGGRGNDTLIGNDRANYLYGDDGDDRLIGAAGDDTLGGADGADVLRGGAGRDWAFYGDSVDKIVDLAAGTGVGGDAEGDTLISIENVTAGYGDDVVIGDEGSNELNGYYGSDRLAGGAGADTLDGGPRSLFHRDVDTADYLTSSAGVVVDLTAGTASGGHAEGDVLRRIEALRGSDFQDVLTGKNGETILEGGKGDDSLTGAGGDDLLVGGAGADFLDGGRGFDTASYRGSARGVVIDFGTGTVRGGEATGDLFNSIEAFSGSDGSDVLKGGDAKDRFNGGLGDDRLTGRGGNDVLRGEEGRDTLDGGGGGDRFVFRTVSESTPTATDTVVDFTHGEGDRLIVHGIDANVGSSSNDFVFIDTEAFSGAAGELRYEADGGFTLVQGDVDGDGSADFEIELTGNIALRAGDFGL